jgi:hypothetical protein
MRINEIKHVPTASAICGMKTEHARPKRMNLPTMFHVSIVITGKRDTGGSRGFQTGLVDRNS